MSILAFARNLLVYKEKSGNKQYEFLEDEAIERESHGPDFIKDNPKEKTQVKKAVLKPLKEKGENKAISKNLNKNINTIKSAFAFPDNKDLMVREFKIKNTTDAAIFYLDGMVDKILINNFIIRQLMLLGSEGENGEYTAQYLADNLLSVSEATTEENEDKIIEAILNGMTAVFVDRSDECIIIDSRGFERRNVGVPQTETVIRGPHEGFTETLRTNITLIRKIIHSENLVTEFMKVGTLTKKTVAVMYIKDVANPDVVDKVRERISSIDTDFLVGDGELCQYIEDHPWSLFPQILSTERPDRAASFLAEGQVVMICDGTPYASAVPVTLFHLMHTSEDTSLRWQFGFFLRVIRNIAAFLAIFLPGIFLSLVLYHQEMIPTELLFSIASSRENIPFPSVIELLLMEVSFELIREASLRVPGAIGQTLGIIGAVVLGEAAVAAGIVSPVLIIIVAICGMSSFAIPNFGLAFAIRLLRFIFIFFAGVAGLFGIAAGIFICGGLLCSMKSFGVPYLSPIAPKTKHSPDVLARVPIRMYTQRPDFLNPQKRYKTKTGRKKR